MKANKLLQAAVAGSFLALSAAPAQAIIFDYVGYGGFLDDGTATGFPGLVFVPGTNNTNAGANVYRGIEWGTGAPPDLLPSGAEVNRLGLAGVADPVILGGTDYGQGVLGTVTSDGASENLGWLTHFNHIINEAFGAGTITIRYDLAIYDGSTFVHEEERLFTLHFTETPNTGTAAACDPSDGVTVCPDFFTYEVTGSPTFGFNYAGVDYLGTYGPFQPSNADGQFISGEFDPGTNDAFATFKITTVPEPTSIALMGLGLLGLVGMTRRRKQAPKV